MNPLYMGQDIRVILEREERGQRHLMTARDHVLTMTRFLTNDLGRPAHERRAAMLACERACRFIASGRYELVQALVETRLNWLAYGGHHRLIPQDALGRLMDAERVIGDEGQHRRFAQEVLPADVDMAQDLRVHGRRDVFDLAEDLAPPPFPVADPPDVILEGAEFEVPVLHVPEPAPPGVEVLVVEVDDDDVVGPIRIEEFREEPAPDA